jgi:hypothetical protein
MILAPEFGKLVWPSVISLMTHYNIQKWHVILFFGWAYHIAFVLISNLVMWAIYHINLPFFERYKINSKQWPWVEDRVQWNKTLKKTLKLVGFNLLFTHPCLLFVSLWITNFEVA